MYDCTTGTIDLNFNCSSAVENDGLLFCRERGHTRSSVTPQSTHASLVINYRWICSPFAKKQRGLYYTVCVLHLFHNVLTAAFYKVINDELCSSPNARLTPSRRLISCAFKFLIVIC